ncbi:GNAT family N-acetyltransferase [Ferrimonas lipolytica]|uniref:GNAT family N-acetyltransferase n=1 Tax=Ferrimonas lipolytica TaxID=2724191 RepID=A0A6H1UDS7_9GAMM|nr:GNAT family N-acetyltransferase [Ferrimonas lipolytica]QIZ77235.1 GNAT family N-acetyltransferase [Ferrimonas lipolytica]
MTSIQQDVTWTWMSFEQLTTQQLYAVLQLREQVFQIEQNSLYVDVDGEDQQALHLLVEQQGQLVGYLRLLQPDEQLIKLGRIVLAPAARGGSLGRALIQEGLKHGQKLNPSAKIKISAQVALEQYYGQFGFEVTSTPYDDGGVMHQDMELRCSSVQVTHQ